MPQQTETRARKAQTSEAKLRSQIERYEAFFSEIDSFIDFVKSDRVRLEGAVLREAQAKEAYHTAKNEVRDLRDSINGAKDALFRLVEPGVLEFMPLFDRMEPADPEKHGERSNEWRKDPIAALRLSVIATKALVDSDIVCVGQLQDLVLNNGDSWWEEIEGLTAAVAAAIVDKLNDFVFRDGGLD